MSFVSATMTSTTAAALTARGVASRTQSSRHSVTLSKTSARPSRTHTRGASVVVADSKSEQQQRAAASSGSSWVRYGVREETGTTGAFQETYGLDLGGSTGRETLTFAAGSNAVSLQVTRPMGIVFEEVAAADGKGVKIVAVEVIGGSNAEAAGVQAGDILRLTSAVAMGKSKVEVGNLQVEPSLAMRKQGVSRKAYFVADAQKFDSVMGAIQSNGEAVDGVYALTVALLLERPA